MLTNWRDITVILISLAAPVLHISLDQQHQHHRVRTSFKPCSDPGLVISSSYLSIGGSLCVRVGQDDWPEHNPTDTR